MKPVVTKCLIIRRMQETDLPDFLAYQTHPLVLKYMPVKPMTSEQAISFLARQAIVEIDSQGGYIAFGIYHIDDAKLIGEVGIYVSPKESKGDIGWSLHPEYQGFGYATEAAEVLLAYAFEQRGLHRITSACDTRNIASFRLMERLGMRREGHLRQSKFILDAWQDEYFLYTCTLTFVEANCKPAQHFSVLVQELAVRGGRRYHKTIRTKPHLWQVM